MSEVEAPKAQTTEKQENSEVGGWWSSLGGLKTLADGIVKKTEEVAEGCKNDLMELSTQSVTTAQTVRQNFIPIASTGVTGAWTAIANFVTEPVDETEEEKSIGIFDSITGILSNAIEITPSMENLNVVGLDRTQLALQRLLENDDLLLKNPERDTQTAGPYNAFAGEFSFTQHAGEIAKLMNENEKLSLLHQKLVPSQVSEDDFWKRYFFQRKLIIEQDEQKRKMIQEAMRARNHEEVGWGDDADPEETQKPPETAREEAQEEKLEETATETKEEQLREEIPPESTVDAVSVDETVATTKRSSDTSYDMLSSDDVAAVVMPKKEPKKVEEEWAEWE